MASETRAEELVARLRMWRMPVFAALAIAVVLCDLLHVADPWENVALAVFAVFFWYVPGIETLVRNFHTGYRQGH